MTAREEWHKQVDAYVKKLLSYQELDDLERENEATLQNLINDPKIGWNKQKIDNFSEIQKSVRYASI